MIFRQETCSHPWGSKIRLPRKRLLAPQAVWKRYLLPEGKEQNIVGTKMGAHSPLADKGVKQDALRNLSRV